MSAGEHPAVAVARRLLDGLATWDPDAIGGSVTEDFVWHAPGTNRFSGRFDGREAALDRLRRMRDAGIVTRLDVHDVSGCGRPEGWRSRSARRGRALSSGPRPPR